jgi:hypothetical protein
MCAVDFGGGTLREEDALYRIISDPMVGSLKFAISKIGERLHELGGANLMRAIAERVAPDDRRRRLLDHYWNGCAKMDREAFAEKLRQLITDAEADGIPVEHVQDELTSIIYQLDFYADTSRPAEPRGNVAE